MSGGARAVVALAALLLLTACSDPSDEVPTPSTSAAATSADPWEVEVGDCVGSTAGAGEVTQIPVVPCRGTHVGEAYASVRMSGGTDFPGQDAVEVSARGCEKPFEEFIGVPLAGSQLEVTYFHPTAESWATGDREILCIVADPAGPLSGSLRGAAR